MSVGQRVGEASARTAVAAVLVVAMFASLAPDFHSAPEMEVRGPARDSVPAQATPQLAQASGIAQRAAGLGFEANMGQHPEDVEFAVRSAGYWVHLTEHAMRVLPAGGDSFELRWARAHGSYVPLEPTGTMTSYIRGDSAQWVQGVPNYGRILHVDAYPGIDIEYYLTPAGQLEFDLRLQPGAQLSVVRLELAGLPARLDTDALLLGDFRLDMPAVYEETPLGRVPSQARMTLLDGALGFEAAPHANTLVIDPVLHYMTYYGGASEDQVFAAAADASGNLYVVGQTASTALPGSNPTSPPQPGYGGGTFDAFVTKITHSGATPSIAWRVYMGGSTGGIGTIGDDRARGTCIDATGNLVVVGNTQSSNFPVTAGALQSANGAVPTTTGAHWDAFVARFSPAGALLSSTYLGGDNLDYVHALACDATGIYLAGSTMSSNLPGSAGSPIQDHCNRLQASMQTTNGSTVVTATVAAFTPADVGRGISGTSIPVGATIVGYTSPTSITISAPATSTSFTSRTIGKTFSGSTTLGSTTITSATAQYSPYDVGRLVTGTGIPSFAVIIDYLTPTSVVISAAATSTASNTVHTVGSTCSSSNQEGFAIKLNPTATALLWSTYLGGNQLDRATGIAVDGGNVYVTGLTNSGVGISTGFTRLPGTVAIPLASIQRTFGSATLTGPTGAFQATDVGSPICGTGIPVGSTITAVASGTSATMSLAATTTINTLAAIGRGTSTSAIQPCYGGSTDAFLVKLNNPANSAGLALQWATYLGGTSTEYDISQLNGGLPGGGSATFTSSATDGNVMPSVSISPAGNPIVVGTTLSTNFPVTPGALRTTNAGNYDLFLTQAAASGASLVASTYFGGASLDYGAGRSVVDPDGSVWVLATVGSSLPTGLASGSNAFSTSCVGCYDLLLAKLDPSFTSAPFYSFLGSSMFEYARALARGGNWLYAFGGIVGSTTTTPGSTTVGFPVPFGSYPLNAPMTYGGGSYDALAIRIDTAASAGFDVPVPLAPVRYVCQNQNFIASATTNYAGTPTHAWTGSLATVTTTPPYSTTNPRLLFSTVTSNAVVTLKTTFTDGSIAFDRQAFNVLASGTGSTTPPTNSLGQYCSAGGSAFLTMPYGLTSSPVTVCVGEPVTFAGAGLWWQFPVNTYTILYGDGTQAGPGTVGAWTKTYTSAGTRTVTLTVQYGNAPTYTQVQSAKTVNVIAAGLNSNGLQCSPSGTATATGDLSRCLGVAASFAASSNYYSPIAAYAWEFGDGSTVGPGSHPTTTYAYSVPGIHTVLLRLTYQDGTTSNASRSISISAGCGNPTAVGDCYTTAGPLNLGSPGVRVNDRAFGNSFLPTSVALASAPRQAANFELRPDGGFTYTPRVGFTGQDSFTYQAVDGPYRSQAAAVCINVLPQATASPPIPHFDIAPDPPVAGRPVGFFDVSRDVDGMVVARSWDFGGGDVADGPAATRTFAPGTYLVRLTVTDDDGHASTLTRTITVLSAPTTQSVPPSADAGAAPTPATPSAPTATPAADPTPPIVTQPPADPAPTNPAPTNPPGSAGASASSPDAKRGFTTQLSGSTLSVQLADQAATGVQWAFGNGATGTGAQATATYAKPGTYEVRVTYRDASGQTQVDSKFIEIAPTAEAKASPVPVAIVLVALSCALLRRRLN